MRQVNSIEKWFLVLLFAQVALSIVLVWKVLGLDTKNSHIYGLLVQNQQQREPTFISGVSVDDDPSIGPASAPVVIVGFEDFMCPACASASAYLKNLVEEYSSEIRFVYRDFPLDSHVGAKDAAIAAECADNQGYFWEMHDLLFENQSTYRAENLVDYAGLIGLNIPEFELCVADPSTAAEVENDIKDGLSYSVRATPTFFINGYRYEGINGLREVVEEMLRKEGREKEN